MKRVFLLLSLLLLAPASFAGGLLSGGGCTNNCYVNTLTSYGLLSSQVASGSPAITLLQGAYLQFDASPLSVIYSDGQYLNLGVNYGLKLNSGPLVGVTSINGGTSFPIQLWGQKPDSASAVGVTIGTLNATYATLGAMLVEFSNNNSRVATIEPSGRLKVLGGAPRREGWYQTITTADTSLTAVGMPAATTTGTGVCTPANDTADNAYALVGFPSGSTSGNSCGVFGPFTTSRATFLPILYSVVRTDPSAVTSTRIYVGLTSATLDQSATLAATNTIKYCAFRYDTGLSDATWQLCSSDGTTASCTSTGTTVSAATTYTLAIDDSVSGTCDFWINGSKAGSKATNINTSNTALGVEASVTTLTTASRKLSISKLELLQN